MRYCILFISYLSIISCGPKATFDQEFDIPDGIWTYGDDIDFKFSSIDTTAYFDIILELTHTETYAYENLYVLITTTFPNHDKVEDRLSINLISEQGAWLGQGNADKKLKIFLQEQVRLNQIGDYMLQFNQHSREDKLKGIKGLRLLLYPAEV